MTSFPSYFSEKPLRVPSACMSATMLVEQREQARGVRPALVERERDRHGEDRRPVEDADLGTGLDRVGEAVGVGDDGVELAAGVDGLDALVVGRQRGDVRARRCRDDVRVDDLERAVQPLLVGRGGADAERLAVIELGQRLDLRIDRDRDGTRVEVVRIGEVDDLGATDGHAHRADRDVPAAAPAAGRDGVPARGLPVDGDVLAELG